MTIPNRIKLAKKALKGVSVGDAFGESFFGNTQQMLQHIQQRIIPSTTWEFTDDTIMTIAIFEQLEKKQTIDQDDLAKQFSINHEKDVNRGYGATARRILRAIGEGKPWKAVSSSVFEGMGSMGNGASMRVSPIGAFYFDDLEKVKQLATASAEITHFNLEGVAGAIAVATATAIATRTGLEKKKIKPNDFINQVAAALPDTDLKSKIKKSITLPYHYHIETIRTVLGDGTKIMAKDTVPFSIWCAAHHLTNFEEALWKAVSILGDRDTICAIVGGIVMMSAAENTVPKEWSDSVEDFENSVFRKKAV